MNSLKPGVRLFTLLFAVAASLASTPGRAQFAAPPARPSIALPVEAAMAATTGVPDAPLPQSTATGQQPAAPQDSAKPAQTPEEIKKQHDQDAAARLKAEEHQRILGVIPEFNATDAEHALPLTPKQKFHLAFKSSTDPFIFLTSGINAGIGQAQNSFSGYGQGAQGYFKRFGASYADTADGNFWGNALFPVLFHEDPRYYRMGTGTFSRRLLYSASTTIRTRTDDGRRTWNYGNVLGNIVAGGISNAYYPDSDRGVGGTFERAATVTAEGVIGAFLIEFWPDIHSRMHRKHPAPPAAPPPAPAP